MKDFRDLKVWERAHQLTLRVYKVSAHFPREGAIWLNQPDAWLQYVDGSEHRRGMWKARKQ